MDFINNIMDNSILIIDNNIKNKVLDYISENKILKNIKIMSFYDIKKALYFDYTNETIFNIMNKFNLNYNIAKKYLNNIYYIIDYDLDTPKYNLLKEIKKYLDEHNLLIYDQLFPNLINNYQQIYVYGFDYLDSFNKHMLDKFNNVIYLNKNNQKYHHDVLIFNNINDEITYIAEEISSLIDKGINLNKIYIANYDNNYLFTINRIFKSYNIPFYLKSDTTLYDTSIGKYVLNNLNSSFNSILNKIKLKYNIENNENNMLIYQKVKSLFDKYYWIKDENIQQIIEEEMKTIKIPNKHMDQEITFTNILNNTFLDDEYVFLINFNQNSIPKYKKDIDYLSDDIKPPYISKTNEYNKTIKESYINCIQNIKNLTITYKLIDNNGECLPSSLIDQIGLTKEYKPSIISNYSNLNNKIYYASLIDKLIKFNETNTNLEILNHNYNIPYNTYDHRYNEVDKEYLLNNIDNTLNFSYSNIQKYYECPFKFYLSNILHIDEFNDTLDTFIGSIFHYTLENYFKTHEDPSIIYDHFLEEYNKSDKKLEFNNKDKFFIKLLKEEILYVIKIIEEQNKHIYITNETFETSKKIVINTPFNTTIKGFVDKILYINNQALIIDYKTGSDQINKELFPFGLNLQLPIYMYLLKILDKDIEVRGIYLQHILNKDNHFPFIDKKDEKINNLKLDGITFGNINNLKTVFDNIENSDIVKGLKIVKKNNDLNYGNRIMNDQDKEELISLVEDKIHSCINSVKNAKFPIKPIKIDDKVDACNYCPYRDICFKKYNDYQFESIKGDDKQCQD